MRFRRETGDFSINLTFDEETNKPKDIQLPKGLSGEDLLGVAIKMPAMGNSIQLSAITTVFDDDGVVSIMLGNNLQNLLYYDPTTGILSANEPERPSLELVADDMDDAGNPRYVSSKAYSSDALVKGANVTLIFKESADVRHTYQGKITDVKVTTASERVEYAPGKAITVSSGTPHIMISFTDETGATDTEDFIYYNKSTGLVGHVAVVFGGSQTK